MKNPYEKVLEELLKEGYFWASVSNERRKRVKEEKQKGSRK